MARVAAGVGGGARLISRPVARSRVALGRVLCEGASVDRLAARHAPCQRLAAKMSRRDAKGSVRASSDVGIHEERTPDGPERFDHPIQHGRVPRRELQVVGAKGLELAGT